MSAVRKMMIREMTSDEELYEMAEIITHQLKRGLKLFFNKVLDVSSGDVQKAGVKPITFIRQVLSGCLYPSLLDGEDFPPDVQLRAQTLLSHCDGYSVGSYTASNGLMCVRNNVARFISLRDGGIPSSPDHIFITCGSQRGLMVYQNTVLAEDKEFVSYKKVLMEMGDPYHERVQLASFHSLSNGVMGECGLRAGFMELMNVDEALLLYTETVLTSDLNSPVSGQIALDVMVDPPRPGDPSYDLYKQELSSRLSALTLNMSRAVKFMNDLSGFTCSPVQSGIYIYPHLTLPHTEHTQSAGLCYCRRLLEDQGVCVGFNECRNEEHTKSHTCCYLRMCVMMSSDELEDFLCRLQTFHHQFLQEY